MQTKMMLALALLVAALATIPAVGGSRDEGQAAPTYTPIVIGGNAGGNLVPLW
jgi:hypothetical protein